MENDVQNRNFRACKY